MPDRWRPADLFSWHAGTWVTPEGVHVVSYRNTLPRKFGSFDPYFVNGVPCGYTDVRQAWAEARQALWQDNADIQAVLDGFVDRANGIVGTCQ